MKRLIATLGIAAALVVPALSACSANPPAAPVAKKHEVCRIKTDAQGHVYCVTGAPHAQKSKAGSNDSLLFWILLDQTTNDPVPSVRVGTPGASWSRATSAPSGNLTPVVNAKGQVEVDEVDESTGQPSNNPSDIESEEAATAAGEAVVDETSNPAQVETEVDPNVDAPAADNGGADSGGDSGGAGAGGDTGGGGDGGGGGE